MAFHQILVSGAPGDAITNQAFELRALLRRVGASEIFARHVHPSVSNEVHDLRAYAQVAEPDHSDVLIYHASIGEPDVFDFLLARRERLVLVYHNISPSSAFRPYDETFADLLDDGRRELVALRDRTVLALADSMFNAQELSALGYVDVRHTPLIVDPSALLDVEPDVNLTGALDAIDGPVVLSVGQMLPHKRHDLTAQAFHVLGTYLEPSAHCFLVGKIRTSGYGPVLRQYVRELNMPRLHINGSVSPEQLAAYYRRADLFVTFSDHEGFCVPLLEAMAFDTPIVARAQPAIAETAGDAALLIPCDDGSPALGPELAAEAMLAVITDTELRDHLVARGRERLAHFDPDRSRSTFLLNLLDVA